MVFLSITAFTQRGDFGMGVILGNPTSFSVKLWTGDVTAIDASLGYRYGNTNELMLKGFGDETCNSQYYSYRIFGYINRLYSAGQ